LRLAVRDAGFNPTMVRLLPGGHCRSLGKFWFQSHNGAIATCNNEAICGPLPSVSIPQWCDCYKPKASQSQRQAKFQSHNGAIATIAGKHVTVTGKVVSIPQWCDCYRRRTNRNRETAKFQSHNGAIATLSDLLGMVEDEGFNPTMVRLLPVKCCKRSFAKFSFNPTMVRLLPSHQTRKAGGLAVSIPQWCDCYSAQ